MRSPAWWVLVVFAAASTAAAAVRVEVTHDTSIVLVNKEGRVNGGGLSQIRIKGNQHMVAMDVDRAPLRGRLVASATLVARKGAARIAGLTISTLMAEWNERKSNALTSGTQAWDGWGYRGARFPAVTGGNAFSLVCQAPSVVEDGWYRWKVEPDLVHALAVGAAHGLTLHEWDADYSRNSTIASIRQRTIRQHTGIRSDSARQRLARGKTNSYYVVPAGNSRNKGWLVLLRRCRRQRSRSSA